MQTNPPSNRSNEPIRVAPLDQAGRVPVLPTSRPARQVRRKGPINPVYLLLITVVPLLLLGTMVWAAARLFPPPSRPQAGVMVKITPAAGLAAQIAVTWAKDAAAQRRDGDQVYVTGQVTNHSSTPIYGVYLKAFLYTPDGMGGQKLVGSGVGSAGGDLAPGATAPFTVTAQVNTGPVPKAGDPQPTPATFQTVDVQVDQLWLPTPTAPPAAKP